MLASTSWLGNAVPQMGCPVCNLTGVVVSSGSGSSIHSVAYLSPGYWFAVPKSQFLVIQLIYVVVVGDVGDMSAMAVLNVLAGTLVPPLLAELLSQ